MENQYKYCGMMIKRTGTVSFIMTKGHSYQYERFGNTCH